MPRGKKIDWNVHGATVISCYVGGMSVRDTIEHVRATHDVEYKSGTLVNFLGRSGVLRTQSAAHKLAKTKKTKSCAHCHGDFLCTSYRQKWCDVCTGFGKYKRRLRAYGLVAVELESMLASQDNSCKICHTRFPDGFNSRDRRKTLYVDHDHVTGRVRGLLCPSCNVGLSHLDRAGWLSSALAYLGQEHPLRQS